MSSVLEQISLYQVIVGICMCIVCVSCVIFLGRRVQAVNLIRSNPDSFTYYLDGVEVDYDKIDLKHYLITIDGDKVLLTRSENKSYNVQPMIMPAN